MSMSHVTSCAAIWLPERHSTALRTRAAIVESLSAIEMSSAVTTLRSRLLVPVTRQQGVNGAFSPLFGALKQNCKNPVDGNQSRA